MIQTYMDWIGECYAYRAYHTGKEVKRAQDWTLSYSPLWTPRRGGVCPNEQVTIKENTALQDLLTWIVLQNAERDSPCQILPSVYVRRRKRHWAKDHGNIWWHSQGLFLRKREETPVEWVQEHLKLGVQLKEHLGLGCRSVGTTCLRCLWFGQRNKGRKEEEANWGNIYVKVSISQTQKDKCCVFI